MCNSIAQSAPNITQHHLQHQTPPLYHSTTTYHTHNHHATMPGCAACNVSKKKCPGGVKACLVEKEKQERKEKKAAEREEKMGGGEKNGGGPAPKVKSPVQTKAMPVERPRAQQPVTAGQAAAFTEILNAARAAPPDVNDRRIWEQSSAVQALLDFPEGDQQPGACPECHEPMTVHYFGCSQYVPR